MGREMSINYDCELYQKLFKDITRKRAYQGAKIVFKRRQKERNKWKRYNRNKLF